MQKGNSREYTNSSESVYRRAKTAAKSPRGVVFKSALTRGSRDVSGVAGTSQMCGLVMMDLRSGWAGCWRGSGGDDGSSFGVGWLLEGVGW